MPRITSCPLFSDPPPCDPRSRSLRQRLVVLLDQLAILLRNVVRAREEHFAAFRFGLTAEVELETLHAFGHRRLEPLECRGILVDAIVVERPQVAQHFVEQLGIDTLPLHHSAELGGVGGELARIAAELTDVAGVELRAEIARTPGAAAVAVELAGGVTIRELPLAGVAAVTPTLLSALALLPAWPCWPLWPCWPSWPC